MQQVFNPVSFRLRRSTGKESVQQYACVKLAELTKARGGRHVQ